MITKTENLGFILSSLSSVLWPSAGAICSASVSICFIAARPELNLSAIAKPFPQAQQAEAEAEGRVGAY